MSRQEQSGSHWHDAEYSLEPHNLRIRANTRNNDAEGANSETDDARAAGTVPRLLGNAASNKRNCATTCCVDACGKDLSKEKEYYQRYRICEEHLRLSTLSVDGRQQRFCQQCGRFHPLADFDDDKRSCRAKLQEHNNRRRKRYAQDDIQDCLEAKSTRSRRKAAVTGEVHAVKARRAPRLKRTRPFIRLLPEDTPTSSSSAGVHRAVHGSDTSTMREASSNSERATGSQELLPADRGWAAVSPPNSAELLARDAAACSATALSIPAHSMPDDALGLTGVEELMTALAPLEKTDTAHRQRQCKSVSAYNGAPVSSTPWESQGSLWDLQQPSDLETFYCQLKNSASSSDHQPAAHPLPEPEQLDIARREELLAIQHHLRLSDPHQVEKARREDLLAIQGHLGLSDHSEKGAAGQEEMYAIQRHLRLTQAQAHAAQLPNRQGYQMPPDTLPSLTGAQMPDASAGLLSSPSSGSSQFTDAQQARHVQQAQHTQQAQHLQYVQQMQQGPHFQAQHVPGRLLSEAAPQRSMLRTGSEDVWQGKARHAPAVVIEELPTAAQSAQEDNMLQAMRMFFDGAVPNGRVIPDNAPHLAQSPMAIAPLHTMNNGGSLMPDSHMKSVTASLQSLQAQNACSMLPVQLPVHRQDSRSRETILSPFQALQAAQQAAASPHGQFGNQLGNPLGAEAVAQQRAVHHEHPSAAYSGFIPPDLQPSVVLDNSNSTAHAEQMLGKPAKRLSVSGSIGNFLSKHKFLASSARRSLRDSANSASNSTSHTTAWHSGNNSLAPGHHAAMDHLRQPVAAAPSQLSSTSWVGTPVPMQAAHTPTAYPMPPAGVQEGTFMPGLSAQGIQHRVPVPVPGNLSAPSMSNLGPESASQHFGRVNLKLSNHTPASIPVELLPHILAMTNEQQLAFIEGHMRAGCVHLVFDIFCQGNSLQWDIATAATHLMGFDAFWRHGKFFAQMPSGAIEWQNGRITHTWESSHLYNHTPMLQLGQSISTAASIVSGKASSLRITAQPSPARFQPQHRGMPRSTPKVLGRYSGKFVVNPDLLSCSSCAQQLSTAHLTALQHTAQGSILIPGLEGVGVLHLEAEEDGFLSAAQPVVVAPYQEVQQDVCKLIEIVHAAGATSEKINRTLEDIGLILQYQDHMLDWDDSDSAQDQHDRPPDWESGWADNLLLSRRNSTGSDLLDTDNSTHCGVLSAAASAGASHSSGSFLSEDDVPSLSGTSNSIQGLLQTDGTQRHSRQQQEYLPFTNPTYIAHIQQVSTKLASICRLLHLTALAKEIAAVSHSMQLNDDDILSAAQTDHEQEERANLSRIPRPPPQAPGPMDSVLPTINESAQSTANSSPAVSTCTGSGSLISHGSDPAASEFAFDILDVPDVVEARAVVGGTAGGEIVERQVNESGQAVITVVLSEQERQLKDSAKEMHEQSKGKGKADAAEPAGRHDDPAQRPMAATRQAVSHISNRPRQRAAIKAPAPPSSIARGEAQHSHVIAPNTVSLPSRAIVAAVFVVFVAIVAAVLAGKDWWG